MAKPWLWLLVPTLVATSCSSPPEKILVRQSGNRLALIDGGIDNTVVRSDKSWRAVATTPRLSDHATSLAHLIRTESRDPNLSILDADARVANSDESSPENIADAIDWSVREGANIIVIPLTLEADSKKLAESVAAAKQKEVLILAAAGNVLEAAQLFPAAYPGVFSVTSARQNGSLSPLANSMADASIAAENVSLTGVGGRRFKKSGTSIAAARAAAVAISCASSRPEASIPSVSSGNVPPTTSCSSDFDQQGD